MKYLKHCFCSAFALGSLLAFMLIKYKPLMDHVGNAISNMDNTIIKLLVGVLYNTIVTLAPLSFVLYVFILTYILQQRVVECLDGL